jgi:hypothetical protein
MISPLQVRDLLPPWQVFKFLIIPNRNRYRNRNRVLAFRFGNFDLGHSSAIRNSRHPNQSQKPKPDFDPDFDFDLDENLVKPVSRLKPRPQVIWILRNAILVLRWAGGSGNQRHSSCCRAASFVGKNPGKGKTVEFSQPGWN